MASQTSDYKISIMSQDEIPIAIDWANKEGWNPGLDDARSFYATDNSGFLIGKLNNAPIATLSAVKYGSSFGFIGLYIVKKDFRGMGYGLKIWQQALVSLKGRNIGLDGVVEQQSNYKKSGFKLAHRNIRFEGKSKVIPGQYQNILDAKNIAIADLCQYDRYFFPEYRDNFLTTWINQLHCHSLAIVEKSKIVGYGSIRAAQKGFKIGPLNAENKDLALELFKALSRRVPLGSDIYLDIPEPNNQALDIAQDHQMQPSFETARMYTGDFPNLPLKKIFGITTFELG